MSPQFENKIPKEAIDICKTLSTSGYQIYLVGGCIRDILLGREVYDFDFATNATPNEVMALFKKVIPTGIKHGTVTIIHSEKKFEVTTYRQDGSYQDGRRPESITFSKDIKDDLQRRDFTINAFAYDPLSDKLLDEYFGEQDLNQGVIRTIGDAEQRFNEDALRMMRACRFTAQLQFHLDIKTHLAIEKLKNHIKKIASERIRDEFIKLIESPKPSIGIETMRTTGLLEAILPDIMNGFGVAQNKYHKYDVYYHTLQVLDAVKNKDYRLRLSALFHDIAKPIVKKIPANKSEKEATFFNHELVGAGVTKRIMRKLKFSNEDTKLVSHLVRQHMFHYTSEWNDGAIRRFINKVKPENLSLLFQLREADRIGNGHRTLDCKELKEFRTRIKTVMEKDSAMKITDLKIDGNILMTHFSLKPGKMIGDLLKHLLELVLDNPSLNTKEKLMEQSQNFLKDKTKN